MRELITRAANGDGSNSDKTTTNEMKRSLLAQRIEHLWRIACYTLLGTTLLLFVLPTRGVAQAINLLNPKNGGQVVLATTDGWLNTIDGNESRYVKLTPGDSAVFAFKGEQPAIFDTFAILILGKGNNVKEFELSAGDSPAGEFDSIGKFTTVNAKFVKEPYQPFKFPPVTAKYFRVELLSGWERPFDIAVFQIRLYGRLAQ
jgi:hypothetical protein